MSQRATVLTMRKVIQRLALALACISIVLIPATSVRADGDQQEAFYFHSPVPLGVDAVRLDPGKKMVYLLASVENQTLDGLHVTRQPHKGRVVRVDGSLVKTYPDALDFRVTATAMPNEFQGVDSYPIETKEPLNAFLLGLKFRLKVFRGLHMQEIKPANVKVIGVPAYQPYDERVYRVSFDTPNIPVDARMVLEVFGPDGQRLTRFHLEML